MEPNFQTSFIPKKPMIEHRASVSQPIGFFTVIAIFILFTVLVASVALYFYRGILKRNIAQMENTLTLARNRFEPAKIEELKVLNRRLQDSSEILNQHIAITPIFKALQDITMKTVRYTRFSYDFTGEKDAKVLVKMTGVALGYSSVALQSDLFTKNKNLIDPVFSNLALDDKGNVMFNLEFFVDPTFVDYQQMLLVENNTIESDINLNLQPGMTN